MAGGDAAVLERVREPLSAFAARVIHVGPVGCGHALKAINNTLLAIHILAAAEGLAALARSGIEPLAALEVLNASSGRSFVTEKLLPEPIASGEFPLNFKLGLLAKDVGIGEQVAKAGGHPSPVTELTAALLRKAKAEIGGDVDYLELVRWARAATYPFAGAGRPFARRLRTSSSSSSSSSRSSVVVAVLEAPLRALRRRGARSTRSRRAPSSASGRSPWRGSCWRPTG